MQKTGSQGTGGTEVGMSSLCVSAGERQRWIKGDYAFFAKPEVFAHVSERDAGGDHAGPLRTAV